MCFSKACMCIKSHNWSASVFVNDLNPFPLKSNGTVLSEVVLTHLLLNVQCKKTTSDRDLRLYGVINELASGYGNFCTECKSRKVNETCYNCLKMFREKVKAKCDDVKAYRNHNPLY